MVSGLSHITLIVKDLRRASEFFIKIFNAKEVYSSGDKMFSLSREKFFLINGMWICVMEGDRMPYRTYEHIAFKIEGSELESIIEKIKNVGAQIREGRPRVQGEGTSVYFYDFDDHLFELHTGNLADRLTAYSEK